MAGTPVKASGGGNFQGENLGKYRTLFLLVINQQKTHAFQGAYKKKSFVQN